MHTCMHEYTHTHTHYCYHCTLASSTEAFQDREKISLPKALPQMVKESRAGRQMFFVVKMDVTMATLSQQALKSISHTDGPKVVTHYG